MYNFDRVDRVKMRQNKAEIGYPIFQLCPILQGLPYNSIPYFKLLQYGTFLFRKNFSLMPLQDLDMVSYNNFLCSSNRVILKFCVN